MQGYLHKQGKYWYLQVDIGKEPSGKRIRRNINTKCEKKTDARKVQAKILTEINRENSLYMREITFSEYMLDWIDKYGKINEEDVTYNEDKLIIEEHMNSYFKDLVLNKLEPVHLQKYYDFLIKEVQKDSKDGLSADIIIRHHDNIREALDKAVKPLQLIASNPATSVELPKDIREGNFIDINKITFSEYMLRWLKDYAKINCGITTYEGYRVIIEKHIKPYFRDLRLQELKPAHIQQYYDFLIKEGRKDGKGGLSANTVKRHHANIRKALDRAVMPLELICSNPAISVELPKVTKFKGKTYNIRQLKKLMEVSKGGPINIAIMLAAGLGLRRGEVCGLKWLHIDFRKDIVRIENTRTANQGIEVEKDAKTEKSNRTLKMPKYLKEYLKDLQRYQQKMKLICGQSYNNDGYVCCWDDGRAVRPDYISQRFKDIIDNNNLPPIRFHDLRHTNATLLLEKGINIKWLSDWLGHSSINTTGDIYAHVTNKVIEEIANTMDEIMDDKIDEIFSIS